MPFWVPCLLVVALTVLSWRVLRPLRLLAPRQFLLSHGMIWTGLWRLRGSVINRAGGAPLADLTILMGGLWTLGGGVCFAVSLALRVLLQGQGKS